MSYEDKEVLDAKIEAAEKAERKKKRKEFKKKMKEGSTSFWQDFKKFITRGNVLDMAVGVIVGGAFTAIINGLSNNILKPLINYLLALVLGKNSLDKVYTYLQVSHQKDEAGNVIMDAVTGEPVIDLANSIYIDWGAFINAIINFLLIAFTLFVIVRTITNLQKNFDRHVNEEKIAKEKAEAEAKAKAEKEAAEAAAKAQAEADAKAQAEAQAKAEAERTYYENMLRQTELLKEIAEKVGK